MLYRAITAAVLMTWAGLAGSGPAFAAPKLPEGTVITQTENLVIIVPPSKKSIYGYSVPTGNLHVVQLKPVERGEVPVVVSPGVACFVQGTAAHAFGAETGKWVSIQLDEPAVPTVHTNMAMITTSSKIYLFSSTSSHWQVIDLKAE